MADIAAHTHVPDRDGVRSLLLDRRRRLTAVPAAAAGPRLAHLLTEVDAALDRLELPGFGLCTRCHEPMSRDRLLADPLAIVCIECLEEPERRALERDLAMAAEVQARLLPPAEVIRADWCTSSAYRPYGPVSGDYVDVLAVGDELLVLVGDVAGKGLAAALLMAQLHALFRATAVPGIPLGELLRRVNALLAAATGPSAYATLVAVRLGAGGRVELSCAGHAPPLLLRASGALPQPADGVPLGLFPTSGYGQQELVLGFGEGLLLYTDGLSEAAAPDGAELGVDGLCAVLRGDGVPPPRELVRRCLEAADRHRGAAPVHDDLTVLAVRREGAARET